MVVCVRRDNRSCLVLISESGCLVYSPIGTSKNEAKGGLNCD